MTANLPIAIIHAVTIFNRIVESTIFITLIKGVDMSPKIVLVTIGALMTLHGIGLYFSAGSMAEYLILLKL